MLVLEKAFMCVWGKVTMHGYQPCMLHAWNFEAFGFICSIHVCSSGPHTKYA
jgi:hypothetical protein